MVVIFTKSNEILRLQLSPSHRYPSPSGDFYANNGKRGELSRATRYQTLPDDEFSSYKYPPQVPWREREDVQQHATRRYGN